MPTETTAAVLVRHGGPEVMEIRSDWSVPDPRPGEVLVKVAAAGVNNTDLWTRQGAYGLPGDPDAESGWLGPLDFPRVQGGDVAGVVATAGDESAADLVGRKVLVDPAIYRDDTAQAPPVGYLGSERDGDLAAQVVTAAPDGVQVVADVVGGPGLSELLPLLSDNGRWVIAGAIAGPVVSLDLRRLYLHSLRLIGSSMHTREDFVALVQIARSGAVRSPIAARYPLREIHAAQEQFAASRHIGKIVLIP